MRRASILFLLAAATLAGCHDASAPPPSAPPASHPRRLDRLQTHDFGLPAAEHAALERALAAYSRASAPQLHGRYHCDIPGPPRRKEWVSSDGITLYVWINTCGDYFFQIVDTQEGVEMWLGPGGCTDCRPCQ